MILALLLAQGELMDGVVAVVGATTITYAEAQTLALQYQSQFPGIPPDTLLRMVVDELVRMELLYQEARRDTTIRVSQDEVEEAVEARIKAIKESVGEEAFNQELERLGMTEADLRAELRDDVKKQLYIQRLVEGRIRPTVTVTPDEVRAFYEANKDSIAVKPAEYKLARIVVLIQPSGPAEQEAYSRAKSIMKKLKRGADFGALAAQYSDDRESAARGGDLGWVPLDAFPPDARAQLERAQPGGVVGPVRGTEGYHLFQLLERRGNLVHIRHILLRVIPTREDSAKAQRKANRILRKLKRGASFGTLASKYSDDPESKEGAGDPRWYVETAMDSTLRAALADAKPGDIVGPVPMGPTLVILKVEDIKPRETYTFDEVAPRIEQLLLSRKIDAELEKLINRLKEEIYVDIRL